MFAGPFYYDLPLSTLTLTLGFKDWGHLSFLGICRGPIQMMAMPEKIKQTESQTDGQNQNQTKQETASALHPQFQLTEVVCAWIVFRQMDDLVTSTFFNSPLFDVIHFQWQWLLETPSKICCDQIVSSTAPLNLQPRWVLWFASCIRSCPCTWGSWWRAPWLACQLLPYLPSWSEAHNIFHTYFHWGEAETVFAG